MRQVRFKITYLAVLFMSPGICWAQDAATKTSTNHRFWDIIVGGGFTSIIEWTMLFAVSAMALLLTVYLAYVMRVRHFCPSELSGKIRELIEARQWREAVSVCRDNESIFARAMEEVLRTASKGESTAAEAASQMITKRMRSIARKIGTLNMCANIAPMIGLLGTVTGLVNAFVGLGTTVGAEKASILAISISKGLYATAAGLLIAVPAIAVAHFCRNILERKITELTEQVETASELIWKKRETKD